MVANVWFLTWNIMLTTLQKISQAMSYTHGYDQGLWLHNCALLVVRNEKTNKLKQACRFNRINCLVKNWFKRDAWSSKKKIHFLLFALVLFAIRSRRKRSTSKRPFLNLWCGTITCNNQRLHKLNTTLLILFIKIQKMYT